MDSPPAAPTSAASFSAGRRKAGTIIALIVALAYGIFLGRHIGAWAGGSDSSGYLNNARLLRAGHLREARRAIAGLPADDLPSYSFIPLGFIPVGKTEMVPTYPIGLSLLMVAVSPFTGWALAPHATMWLHLMAGAALMYALARAWGFSVTSSFFGLLLLALCPLYLFMGVQAMSDVPALVWCTAAVYFAWLSRKKNLWALAAGTSVAIAVLVRPSDLLIVVPVALCLGLAWRRWLWLIAGGVPGAALQLYFNLALYHNALTTGYGSIFEIFRLEYAPPALRNYAQWLPVLLTPGIALLLVAPWRSLRESRQLIAILASWVAVFLGFYVFYYHTHETWWYLRFILPAFPPLILALLLAARGWLTRDTPAAQALAAAVVIVVIATWGYVFGSDQFFPNPDQRFPIWAGWSIAGALLLLGVVTRRTLPRREWIAGAIAAAVIFGGAAYWIKSLSAMDSGRGEKQYPDAAQWIRANLPRDSVLLSMQMTGALLYYTDYTFLRYDQFDQKNFSPVDRFCREKKRPVYAVLFPFELKEVMETRLPGRWTQVGTVRQVTIWRRDAPADAAAAPAANQP